MKSRAIRATSPRVRSGTITDGIDDEEEGESDDSDKVYQRYFDGPRAKEVSMGKESSRVIEIADSRATGVLVFVGNLPFKVTIRWLLVTFQRYGRVLDAFIPSKLTRGFGRKFGFVRFGSDRDAAHAIRGMDGCYVGKWNLIVQRAKAKSRSSFQSIQQGKESVSKFSKFSNKGMSVIKTDEFVCQEVDKDLFQNCHKSLMGQHDNHKPGVSVSQRHLSVHNHADRGCVEVCLSPLSRSSLSNRDKSENKNRGVFCHDNGLEPCTKNSISGASNNPYRGAHNSKVGKAGLNKRVHGLSMISDWEHCAALAILRNGKCFFDMRLIIMDSCSFVRSISLIKENQILIVFQSSFHRGFAIDNGLWAHWFFSIEVWGEGKMEGPNRLWVECRGIPFCAWNEATFEAIASVWGSIVEVDPETSNMVQLSSARFCISSSACTIEDTVELQVGENIFDVSVSCSTEQNKSSANMAESLLLGYHKSMSGRGIKKGNTSLCRDSGESPRSLGSHSMTYVQEDVNVQSENKRQKGIHSVNAIICSEESSVQVIVPSQSVELQGNGLSDPGAINSEFVRPSTPEKASGKEDAESDPGDFIPNSAIHKSVGVSPLRAGVNARPICGASNTTFSQAAIIQKEARGTGLDAAQLVFNQINIQKGVGCSTGLKEQISVMSKATDISADGDKQGEGYVFHRNNCESVAGLVGMVSEADCGHGILRNGLPKSTRIIEYNKEIVIPDKFGAISGSFNISKACFYAVCNRLIEVIDEIIEMSSDMGIHLSFEAQRGIKEVMINRQTRALSMIMDNV